MTIVRVFPKQRIANDFAQRFYRFWKVYEPMTARKVGGIYYIDNNDVTYMYICESLMHMTLGLRCRIEYFDKDGNKLREEEK